MSQDDQRAEHLDEARRYIETLERTAENALSPADERTALFFVCRALYRHLRSLPSEPKVEPGEGPLEILLETRWNPVGDISEWVKTADGRNYALVQRAIDALRKLNARAGREGNK